ncbi:hypothetical protein EDI_031790 [Entamoeba dispar SAW760]|uniref:C2H2-type domain-containing protein n=1 Tax=Entamoeba dispar (strain ATCC PRA-260 / SAW760) TaxID=370354 RepID=B0EQN9_ENTDS|nr:uncharacterized protein EDI_031790 [Entamoeba dispar SAW760]EDR23158.1 hypothetical protein EDI_031790 [Entamoeba dispar SAW760]|eukprot:EDR23158.1 hypothetical protein EDI_031790 [Entamoeba dispar SAW760]
MSDKRLSYLDNLFQHNDEDEDDYDWENGNEDSKKIQLKLNETKTTQQKKLVQKKQVIKKCQNDEYNKDAWEVMMDCYKENPITTKEETKESEDKNEIKSDETKKNILRWNKRTQTMNEEDWKAVELEYENSCIRLEHENKRVLKGKELKRHGLGMIHGIDVKKIRSMIEDFGERIVQPPWFVCVICRRQFKDKDELQKHCNESIFHCINCKLLNDINYEITDKQLSLKQLPSSLSEQTSAYPTTIPNINENIGAHLLKQMGWDESSICENCVPLTVNTSRAGIGSSHSSVPLPNPSTMIR